MTCSQAHKLLKSSAGNKWQLLISTRIQGMQQSWQRIPVLNPVVPDLYRSAMRFAQEQQEGNVISAYGDGRVIVKNEVVDSNIVITPEMIDRDRAPAGFDALDAEYFTTLLELNPEIVLIGTGAHLRFPDPGSTVCLLERGIGVEIMDTAAACRTFNILLSEDRRVIASLLMI